MEYRRTKSATTEEAKKLTDNLIKVIFKHYKEMPHTPLSPIEAYEQVSDMATIEELLCKIIDRRNRSLHPLSPPKT